MVKNSSNTPEYVYIHNVDYNTTTAISTSTFGGDLTIISIVPLNENAIKVKLSTIEKKCYINGYGIYEP